ncbi:hypothetical protein PWH76_18170, partial [Salmonella enterica subsp. enterica]
MARIQCNRDRGNNSFDGVICLARGKSLTVYYMLLFVLKNLYTANVIQNESTFSAKWHLNRSQFGIRIDHD